jgi:hypothetical protein
MFNSASFVINCFFKKQEQKLLMDEGSGLNEDDVRILRVLERVTDGVTYEDLNKIKSFLIVQINLLSSSPNAYSVAVNVLYAISKSIAKISFRDNSSVKGKRNRAVFVI